MVVLRDLRPRIQTRVVHPPVSETPDSFVFTPALVRPSSRPQPLYLASDLQPHHLVFVQPKTSAHTTPMLWECDTSAQQSLTYFFGIVSLVD